MIGPCIMAEREKLKHLQHASTSGRTAHMIEHLLQRMNHAAIHDFRIALPSAEHDEASDMPSPGAPALRFSTPFYHRRPNHPFHVRLLVDMEHFGEDAMLDLAVTATEGLLIAPVQKQIPLRSLRGNPQVEWEVTGRSTDDQGEIVARVGNYFAWCEIVIAERAVRHAHHAKPRPHKRQLPRDQGEAVFTGYEFRYLGEEAGRAVYSPQERKILINTAAPTVQLYLDGRGNFRDSARLLLAELFMDVISDELARYRLGKNGMKDDVEAFQRIKQAIIRRYGSDIHLSFLNA